jgi:hypothetical protein
MISEPNPRQTARGAAARLENYNTANALEIKSIFD